MYGWVIKGQSNHFSGPFLWPCYWKNSQISDRWLDWWSELEWSCAWVNNKKINPMPSQAEWFLKSLCVCEYNDVRACDREKAMVERWRWPKWQRQIEISKRLPSLISKGHSSNYVTHWFISPEANTPTKASTTHKHTHAQTQIHKETWYQSAAYP